MTSRDILTPKARLKRLAPGRDQPGSVNGVALVARMCLTTKLFTVEGVGPELDCCPGRPLPNKQAPTLRGIRLVVLTGRGHAGGERRLYEAV